MPFRHILLTTDFSEEASRSFPITGRLAASIRADLTLFHAVSRAATRAPFAPADRRDFEAAEEEDRVQAAYEWLKEQRRGIPDASSVRLLARPSSNVARSIADLALEEGADLIALSTHGLSGFQARVVGGVVDALLRESTVPLLCFPRNP